MRPSRATLLYILLCLSGIAGLGYEIVWTRMFAIGLGHEVPSMLSVIAAFFMGLAIGAIMLDGPVSRSAHPGRWYAGLELIIGLWGIASIVIIPVVDEWLLTLIGPDPSPARHWACAFGIPCLAVLPATIAMGGTLPAMDRFVARCHHHGQHVGGLYAANTLGAMAGVLLMAFTLMPALGYQRSVLVLAIINILCAIGALVLAARPTEAPEAAVVDAPDGASWISRPRIFITLFLTGCLGIGFEVVGIRVLNQVLENTVYTFAVVLAVYLIGTALGAALYQAFARRLPPVGLLQTLLATTSIACLASLFILNESDGIYDRASAWLGASLRGAVGAEMLLALCVFLLPTVLMGATFSHLAQAARRETGGVGWALGINTIGASLAPLLFGVLVLPWLGARTAIAVSAFGYLLLMPLPTGLRERGVVALTRPLVLVTIPIAQFLFTSAPLQLVEPVRLDPSTLLPADAAKEGKVLEFREGVLGAVAVVTDQLEYRYLKVNNRFSMGAAKPPAMAERRQAHLPLLLHPDPTRALYLGVGTGITVGAGVHHPGLTADAIELVPEVVELLDSFSSLNNRPSQQESITLHVADARRFVRTTDTLYDVIIADLFHPARDGAGSLYTVEHFESIRDRLAPGGLFCQWLPLHQLDLPTLQTIVRTYLDVFPEARAFITDYNIRTPTLGLIGGVDTQQYPPVWFSERVTDAGLRQRLGEEPALRDDFTLFGCFVAGAAGLTEFAGEGPLNVDDHPIVTFEAPRFTYASGEEQSTYGRLLALLEAVEADPIELFKDPESTVTLQQAERLRGFIDARNLYVQSVVNWQERDIESFLVTMVQSVERSVHFPTSYAVATQYFGNELFRQNPERAMAFLQEIEEARRRAVEVDQGLGAPGRFRPRRP